MTENPYKQISEKIKMGFTLRDNAEDSARRNDNEYEVELALFMAEMLHKYALEVVQMTKDNDDSVWYVINGQAECLAKNLEGTMTRLKMCLYDYEPEKEFENKDGDD